MTVSPPDEPAPSEAVATPRQLALMSVGTLLIGGSGYLFLALIGHGRFDAPTTAALSALYLLSNILGPGIFVAVEQETSRVTSAALAAGSRPGVVARRSLLVAVVLALVTLGILAVATPELLVLLLDDRVGFALALALMMGGSAAMFWLRGIFGGQRRFGSYASTLLIDAGVRIVGCVGLALAGIDDPFWYAVAVCAGPVVAFGAMALLRSSRRLSQPAVVDSSAADPGFGVVLRGTATLLVASGLSMAMANLAPVVVKGALVGAPEIAVAFTAAVVLTRVPLLLMGPVQALVLPRMTAAVTLGDLPLFRRQLHHGLLLIAAIGTAAVVGTLLLGRFAVRLMFGSDADLMSTGRLVLLALAAAVQATILLVQPALVALGRHRAVLVGWAAGAVAFGLAFLIPVDPLDRATIAQLAGPVVTLSVHLLLVRTRGRSVPIPVPSTLPVGPRVDPRPDPAPGQQ